MRWRPSSFVWLALAGFALGCSTESNETAATPAPAAPAPRVAQKGPTAPKYKKTFEDRVRNATFTYKAVPTDR